MSDESAEQPAPPVTKPAPAGASDTTLWILLGAVTFFLLVCILFIFAAS